MGCSIESPPFTAGNIIGLVMNLLMVNGILMKMPDGPIEISSVSTATAANRHKTICDHQVTLAGQERTGYSVFLCCAGLRSLVAKCPA